MPRIHLDTDLGGDMDDLCALAMLLRLPEVDLTGITTVAEARGRRAGYAHYLLGLVGRSAIPVAAGADVGDGFYRYPELDYADEARYWPDPVTPVPGHIDAALDLLQASIEQGATVIAIGPYTNLRLLEARTPGILARAKLVLMGGYVYPIRPGYPAWHNAMDWNIQVDVPSAQRVLASCDPLLVPLTVTVETALRRSQLPALAAAGPLGRLIARQAEAFAVDNGNEATYGATCAGLPADLINFQHDPLACAIALGWDGVTIATVPLTYEVVDSYLVERIDPAGKPVRLVTQVDGPRFDETWLTCMTADSPSPLVVGGRPGPSA